MKRYLIIGSILSLFAGIISAVLLVAMGYIMDGQEWDNTMRIVSYVVWAGAAVSFVLLCVQFILIFVNSISGSALPVFLLILSCIVLVSECVVSAVTVQWNASSVNETTQENLLSKHGNFIV